MCGCDYDGPSVSWETRPKAKKQHRCCECRGWIEPGEVYWRVRGVWDGEAQTFSMCTDCEDIKAWASEGTDCFCWSFGSVLTDALDFMHESGDAALIAEAKARVKAVRQKRREKIAA